MALPPLPPGYQLEGASPAVGLPPLPPGYQLESPFTPAQQARIRNSPVTAPAQNPSFLHDLGQSAAAFVDALGHGLAVPGHPNLNAENLAEHVASVLPGGAPLPAQQASSAANVQAYPTAARAGGIAAPFVAGGAAAGATGGLARGLLPEAGMLPGLVRGIVEGTAGGAASAPSHPLEGAAGGAVLGGPLGALGGRVEATARAAAAAEPIAEENILPTLQAVGYRDLPSKTGTASLPARVAERVAGSQPVSAAQALSNQAVDTELGRQAAAVPPGAPLMRGTVRAARSATYGPVYNQVEQDLPAQMTGDAQLKSALGSAEGGARLVPRATNLPEGAFLNNLENAGSFTPNELMTNLQTLRDKAARYLNSSVAGDNDLGDAYNKAADAYEDFIERQLGANPNAKTTIEDFRNARQGMAQSYGVESALGGHDPLTGGQELNAGKILRVHTKNPGLLTGPLRLIAEHAQRFPTTARAGSGVMADTGIGASGTIEGGLARNTVGPAIGATVGSVLGGPIGGLAGGTAGFLGSAAIQGAARRALAGTPVEAAALARASAEDPRIANIFKMGPRWTPRTPPELPPGTVPFHPPEGPGPLTASPPTGPAPGGGAPGGGIPLADLLSHGVEQEPATGLSSGPMGTPAPNGMPFRVPPEPMAGNLELMHENRAVEHGEPLGDVPSVMSQGVPADIATRTAPVPAVTHEADEVTGAHVVRSPNGETHAQESGPFLVIKRTDTVPAAQGQGEDTARAEALIQQAEARGLRLGSDVSVSPAHAKTFGRLKRLGYDVTTNPFTVNPATGNLVSAAPNQPIFEVRSPLSLALAGH